MNNDKTLIALKETRIYQVLNEICLLKLFEYLIIQLIIIIIIIVYEP